MTEHSSSAISARRAALSAAEHVVAPPATPAASAGEPGQPVKKKKKKKICCACPDTKLARDECVVINGEDACSALVEAHKACLRAEGFSV
jgi:cytochrome c oxidase assembly protein subunit 17